MLETPWETGDSPGGAQPCRMDQVGEALLPAENRFLQRLFSVLSRARLGKPLCDKRKPETQVRFLGVCVCRG